MALFGALGLGAAVWAGSAHCLEPALSVPLCRLPDHQERSHVSVVNVHVFVSTLFNVLHHLLEPCYLFVYSIVYLFDTISLFCCILYDFMSFVDQHTKKAF